ncbi:MAG TPA: hypothetical protein VH085_08105 [Nocardioides sp.]|nr:hypothetical protein [Nocardioides sp.]
MQWSVSAQASGDRVLSREEIVELADAVAPAGGVASGIGQTAYGAQLIVEADTREEAVQRGAALFTAAATSAGLPAWPISAISALGEDEDDEVEGP